MKFIYAMIIITVLAISIGSYYLNRWWNWNFSYKQLVQQTIKPYIDESRQREEGLLLEVNLLQKQINQEQYQIDILATSSLDKTK